MKLSEYFRVLVGVSLSLLLFGCGEGETGNGETGATPDSNNTQGIGSTNEPVTAVPEKSMKEEGLGVGGEIESTIASLPKLGDPLTSISRSITEFEHEVFAEAATEADWPTNDAASLFDEVRDPNGPWSYDPELKRAVVGKIALLTGFIGEAEESYADLPRMFSQGASQPAPTKGDVLLLRAVEEAAKQRRVASKASDRQMDAWNELARAQNPVYREIAIILASKLDLTEEQSQEFLSNFDKESDERVLERLVLLR